MRRLLGVLCFFALSVSAWAQFTTVSGTVTDPNGLPYANGTINPTLVISSSPKFTATNQPYTPPSQPIGLSSAGAFVMQLADVTALTPAGGTYSFTVSCAAGCIPVAGGKGPVTFTVTGITISGASQSISATLNAAALALSFSGGGGISGLTTNVIPKATSATSIGNSLLDDGLTVASTLTYTGSGGLHTTGTNGGYTATEGTCAGVVPAAGVDILCANSGTHTLQLSNNGSSLTSILTGSGAVVQSFVQSCGGGVMPAAQSVGIGLLGANTNVNCNGAYTANSGLLVLANCTINGDGLFRFTSSAAGVNASDGVIAVFKNGVSTAITCTVGTGTSCTDVSHTVSAVAGDRLSVQVITQAATTLANPEVGFTCR